MLGRLGASRKKHQEKCTIACLTMLGSPVGPFIGSSWRRQTTLHVKMFNMSDQVALNGQSTCNKHTCDQNMRKMFLNCAQAHLVPKLPILESQCVCKRSRKRTRLRIMRNDQTAYQSIHFKHNNNITWTKTVL